MRVSAGVTAALAVAVAIGAGAAAAAQSSSGTTARSVKDGVYTTEQAARGRSVYAAHCAECHMPDLAGHEYAGALAGYGFQLKWQDAPLGELLGRIRSMPLGRPGSLGSQDYVDILAYVLQKNSYPAGTTELSASVVSKWPQLRIERVLHAPDGAPWHASRSRDARFWPRPAVRCGPVGQCERSDPRHPRPHSRGRARSIRPT